MSDEHPIKQEIKSILITDVDGGEVYEVGRNNVTKIEGCIKSGMHADIPYIRVWKEDICFAEFCQHNIVGVYFKEEKV